MVKIRFIIAQLNGHDLLASTSSQKVFNVKAGCAKELRQIKADTISLSSHDSFASFIVAKSKTSVTSTSNFDLNFKFRSPAKSGPMVQLPLLMSGFLFLDFNEDSIGLGLIIGNVRIWHHKVNCVLNKSNYDEWNQVALKLAERR